ncbi:MAG: hypothetical protein KDI22_04075 [Gammaproteobacteria bacterium]|nr:hypothetical protein [Gammaproteobacteria bacterium]MCP5316878.1 hypothetical protein [Chromatiaceae bacterium]MCW5586264.1 hypothetical protein [Chromatiales bacterium]MCB1816541.1 hypothetical protein [Gammaproteobacteria bacterium]MCP5428844.1 hypothetical protein [Chromatiaceae bacterium]
MTTATQQTSGSAWFSKLVVVLLLALAVGLYLRIVMVEETGAVSYAAPQASMRVVEGKTQPAGSAPVATPKDLPEDQMALIKRVFAPEIKD